MHELPLDLGRLVRRRVDPEGSLGLIVGLIFRPEQMAIVRWPGGVAYDEIESLIDSHGQDLGDGGHRKGQRQTT